MNVSTLRTTWEAKQQLKSLLISQGFPEDSFMPRSFDAHNDDPDLDLIVALLAMGLYPNVCLHKEKRRVLTTEAKAALVHKSSVNCSRDPISFPSPFFVFGEKIRTRAVSCKQMTMVSPLHLLLFASRKIDLLPSGVVRLDNWINLKMDPVQASLVTALRPALETLVASAADDAEGAAMAAKPEGADGGLVSLLRGLARVDAGSQGTEGAAQVAAKRPPPAEGFGGPPPTKRGSFHGRGGMRGGF